jgi:hypothetical protein
MAVNAQTPVVIGEAATRFRYAHHDTSLRGAGLEVDIFWNALRVITEPDPADQERMLEREEIVRNCGPYNVKGEALEALMTDADNRTQAYKAAGLPQAQAYQLGHQDAIYAALGAAGLPDFPAAE